MSKTCVKRTVAIVGLAIGVGGVALCSFLFRNPITEYPCIGPTTDVKMEVIDIHTHFFNHCDLPEQAVQDPFNVHDQTFLGRVAKRIAIRFRDRANAGDVDVCNDLEARFLGSTTLRRKGAPRKLEQIDFLRAGTSDRLALAHRYFEMYPDVALTTPLMVDADGWMKNPNNLPRTATWEQRHAIQRDLAKHLNDEFEIIRVLPIAGFNPMRAVRIDCNKAEFGPVSKCDEQWRWLRKSKHSDDYLAEFETLFQPSLDGKPPFIGVKIYPSTGYSPAPHCAEVAKVLPGERKLNEIAGIVAMAPLRYTYQWEGLPEPAATSGCRAMHDTLMEDLRRAFDNNPADVLKINSMANFPNVENADYTHIEMQVALVAFLRLSAEIDRIMVDFYEMTHRLDLPIIAHASPEGFALDDDYFGFGSMADWENALPQIAADQRLLFAHAGGPPRQKNSFFDEVIKLISDGSHGHRHLFVDLSANGREEWNVDDFKGQWSQIVYGSDYWMTTRDAATDTFLANHRTMSPEHAGAYMRDNAIEFLAPANSANRARICSYLQDGRKLADSLSKLCL